MTNLKKTLTILLVFVMVLTLSPIQANAAKKVKLNKSKLPLYVGKSYTLKLKNNKSNVKWSSSKKAVATVSSKGKVKAKKKGNCKITAKVGKKKYVCKVTVKKKVSSSASNNDSNNDNSNNDSNDNNNSNNYPDTSETTPIEQKTYSVEIIDVLGSSGSYDKIEMTIKNTGTTKIRVGLAGAKLALVRVQNALAGSVLVQSSTFGYGLIDSIDIEPGESYNFSFTRLYETNSCFSYYKTFHLCSASSYSVSIYDYESGETHIERCYVK